VLGLALSATAVALLGGPTAYSLATIGHGQADDNPTAGPGRRVDDNTVNAALVTYLKAHRDGARYLIAGTDVYAAAPVALATGAPVITIGGFDGTTPAPTTDQLKAVIARGELRYLMPGYFRVDPPITDWVQSHCQSVTIPDDPATARGRTAAGAHQKLTGRAALLAHIREAVDSRNWVYLCTPADASGAAK
jgi:hypothetical protein